jgi:hypothetical protein
MMDAVFLNVTPFSLVEKSTEFRKNLLAPFAGFPSVPKMEATGSCCCSFSGGAYQHCSHEGLLYSNPPMEFRHSSP